MTRSHRPTTGVLFLSVLGLVIGCGSADEESEGAGGETASGGMATSGGAVSIDGSGGASASTGGLGSNVGGATMGVGGTIVGVGGTTVGVGGTTVGVGGTALGVGGAALGVGGAAIGLGGAVTGLGGAVTGLGGAVTGLGGAVTGLGGAVTGLGGAVTGLGGSAGEPPVTAGSAGAAGMAGAGGVGAAGAAGGATGSGGSGTGGDPGTGGSGTGGSSGCPLELEGFATLNADGQNGTYGGRDGETVTVTNETDLDTYATATEPYTIRVDGPITITPKGREIRVASDKTIIGVGTTGEIVEGGFFLAVGVHNVILRNLTIRDTFVEGDWAGETQDFDGIQMDTAHHVWIDHCHLHHGGDGLIDSRHDTTSLTVSWSILSDHNKAFGIGWTDNVTAEMTIHHNILRDLNQRNPSTDNVLRAHLFNNWLLRIDSYGNYARGGTNMVIENTVFDTVNNPHYYDTGSLVAIGNLYRSTTGQQESSGSTYSFFDPSDFYDYTLDPADEVEALLSECAGPRPELGQ